MIITHPSAAQIEAALALSFVAISGDPNFESIWDGPPSLAQWRSRLGSAVKAVITANGSPVGLAYYQRRTFGIVEMHLVVHPLGRGRWFGRQFCREWCGLGFELGRRLVAYCLPDGDAARICAFAGFVFEGRLRAHAVVRGQPKDVLVYGMLSGDRR